jgi:hypothetical protein
MTAISSNLGMDGKPREWGVVDSPAALALGIGEGVLPARMYILRIYGD